MWECDHQTSRGVEGEGDGGMEVGVSRDSPSPQEVSVTCA